MAAIAIRSPGVAKCLLGKPDTYASSSEEFLKFVASRNDRCILTFKYIRISHSASHLSFSHGGSHETSHPIACHFANVRSKNTWIVQGQAHTTYGKFQNTCNDRLGAGVHVG